MGGLGHGVHRGEKTGFGGREQFGVGQGTGGVQPDDLAADQALGELWILHLLTQRDRPSRPQEFGDVAHRSMIGDPAERDRVLASSASW